ncbi:protein transporter of the TRAM superfamily, partial [Leptodontidium sp. 2 PMI_412]
QLEIALALVVGMTVVHILSPQLRMHTRKFFSLSYEASTGSGSVYMQGTDDVYFVVAWIVYFTALRALLIELLLQPLARILGVVKKSQLRFAEQGWIFLYYSTMWVLGMSLWVNSEYWVSHAELWTAWPAREMSGLFKLYYLIQLAFSAQLLLAIHMEARRKDYVEMLTHHIITCSLFSITYVYRYTRAANVVLCLMDFVDILLPFAKLLRYLRYEMACNIAFGVFVVSWFITRHVLFLQLLWNTYKDVPGERTMLYGCYNGATSQRIQHIPAQPDYFSHLLWPFQDLEGVICLNSEVKYIFLGMLFLLHTLSSIWFVMILKVIAGIFSGKSAEDIRSDDEGGQQEESPIENLNPCTGVGSSTPASRFGSSLDQLNPCTGDGKEVNDTLMEASNMSKRPEPATARRRLIVAENRKELLSRIGCEKPI